MTQEKEEIETKIIEILKGLTVKEAKSLLYEIKDYALEDIANFP